MRFEQRLLATPEGDPFHAFREVALLEVTQQFSYRHSLGKTSRFFLGLSEGKVLATQCESCGSVYMPPRAVCPKDLTVTMWRELSGRGKLATWTVCPHPPGYAQAESPLILAYVNLEGTTSLFLHQLKNIAPDALNPKLDIKTVFSQHAVAHPLEQMWFEPL